MTMGGLSKDSRIEVEGIITREIETLSKSIHEKISWFSDSINDRMNRMQKSQDDRWDKTVSFQKSVEETMLKLTKSIDKIKTVSHIKQSLTTLLLALPGSILAVFVIIQYLK